MTPRKLSLLSEEKEKPSVFLCVDDFIEDPEEETGRMPENPLRVYRNGRWGKNVQMVSLFPKDRDYALTLPARIRSERGRLSVLLASYGGSAEATNTMMETLEAVRDLNGWSTQSIILQANSGAANVAISTGSCFALDDATVLYHLPYGPEAGVTTSSHLKFSNPYAFLNRLKALARDTVAFERSGFEKRIHDVFDRPEAQKEHEVRFTGEELRTATVLSHSQRMTAQDIADAVDPVLQSDPPPLLREYLEKFRRGAFTVEHDAAVLRRPREGEK